MTSAEFQLVTCGEEGRGDARRTGGAAKMQNVSSVAPSLRSDGIPARHTFPERNLRFLIFLRPPVGSVPSAAHQLRTFSRGEAYPNASGVPGEPEIQAAVAAAEEGGREARCYVAVHEVGVVN